MPIKVSDLAANQSKFIRETTAAFKFVEKGEERIENIRVQYYSHAIKKQLEIQKDLSGREAKGESLLMSDILITVLHSLPDFVDAKGKPAKVTRELLNEFNVDNLNAIQQAIAADVVPKRRPSA